MVPILDGNSEHVAHAWNKIGLFYPICDCSRSEQMPKNRWNSRDCSFSAHQFLSYHLIYVPCQVDRLTEPRTLFSAHRKKKAFNPNRIGLKYPLIVLEGGVLRVYQWWNFSWAEADYDSFCSIKKIKKNKATLHPPSFTITKNKSAFRENHSNGRT